VLRALLLFLFFTFLIRAVWRLLDGVMRGAAGDPRTGPGGPRRDAQPSAVKMAQCPVCGTYVVPGKALTTVSRGQTVYFCSDACRAQFAA
jgi:YHS domain-containing protein